jgi:hypothetical protein
MKRLRGLRALVEDVVEHGSKAVEDVHKATAARTFFVLEAIAPIAKPARMVHTVHDVWLSGIYGTIRVCNKVLGKTLEVAIDVAEGEPSPPPDAEPPDAERHIR